MGIMQWLAVMDGRESVGWYGGMLVLECMPLAVSIVLFVRHRMRQKATFGDAYVRVVPSQDHPAVLGELYRGYECHNDDMVAAIMRLVAAGTIRLDVIERPAVALLGKGACKQDYQLTRIAEVENCPSSNASLRASNSIDRATMAFLFDTVAQCGGPYGFAGSSGDGDRVVLSDLQRVATEFPYEYLDACKRWRSCISDALDACGYVSNSMDACGRVVLGSAILYGVMTVVVLLACVQDSFMLALLGFFLNLLASIACGFICCFMKPVSQEGVELRAKLQALRSWLKDFSRLDEAVSTNATYWSKLLVTSVALGVADDVVKQLGVVAPTVLRAPLLAPCLWDGTSKRGTSYTREMGQIIGGAYTKAHNVVDRSHGRNQVVVHRKAF